MTTIPQFAPAASIDGAEDIWLVKEVGGALVDRRATPDQIAARTLALAGFNPAVDARIAAATIAGGSVSFLQSGTSAVTRTMQAKAREVVSVLDFATDADRTAIQARTITTDVRYAFVAALAASTTVFVPPGLYPLSSWIAPQNNSTIFAEPGTATLFALAGNTSTPLLFNLPTRAAGCRVVGLTFDGNRANIGNFNTVAQVFSSTRVVFSACRWVNTRGIGVLFSTGIQYSGVESCQFDDVGTWHKETGLDADRRAAVAFCCGTRDNNVGNFVRDSQFNEIGLDSISFANQASGVIVGNTMQKTYASGGLCYLAGCLNTVVVGNVGRDISGNGIDILECDGVVVVGNYLTRCGSAGIMLAETTNFTVTGNVCLDCDQEQDSVHAGGIVIDGVGAPVGNGVIVGNVSRDTKAEGLKLQRAGFHVRTGSTVGRMWIDRSNDFTGNLAEFGGSPLLSYSSAPPLWTPAAAVTLTANGQMAIEATSNTTATLRFRGSDGVTRSVALTLA